MPCRCRPRACAPRPKWAPRSTRKRRGPDHRHRGERRMSKNLPHSTPYLAMSGSFVDADYAPVCGCGEPAVKKQCGATAKPENQGRWFYACSTRKEDGGCGFFVFTDSASHAPAYKAHHPGYAAAACCSRRPWTWLDAGPWHAPGHAAGERRLSCLQTRRRSSPPRACCISSRRRRTSWSASRTR